MTSIQTGRLEGSNSSLAVKAPVRSVCTTNITASGLSAITTIDGSLTPAANDRFLLAGQTSSVDNGIYIASTGDWTRAPDFDTNRDVRKGTLIVTQSGLMYRLTASDPIVIGTTALTFTSNDSSTIVASLASTAVAAGASLVGINDAGGTITATTVEAALQEITAASWVSSARVASNAITPIKLANASLAGHTMVNGTLTASVGSSALTVAIKTLAGTDPSATDPVYILFRNATAATGDYAVITLTAATSFTVSSGSTLGASSGTAFRVWLVGFNDAGTFRIGAVNCVALGTQSIYPLGSLAIGGSSAEGGAGGADSAVVIYTGTAVTSKAYAVLGYLSYESGLTVAGTWDAVPTRIELFHRGCPLPGTLVQTTGTATPNAATGTTTVPNDNTTPQNTEGDEYMTKAITPTGASNVLRIKVRFSAAISAGSPMAMALFQDSTADALTAAQHAVTADVADQMILDHMMIAGTTSSTTLKVRAGPSTAGTMTFNGAAGAGKFNLKMFSTLQIEELQG